MARAKNSSSLITPPPGCAPALAVHNSHDWTALLSVVRARILRTGETSAQAVDYVARKWGLWESARMYLAALVAKDITIKDYRRACESYAQIEARLLRETGRDRETVTYSYSPEAAAAARAGLNPEEIEQTPDL